MKSRHEGREIITLGNFDAQRNRHRSAQQRSQFRKNDYNKEVKIPEVAIQKIEKNTTIACVVLSPIPGKINEVPLFFSRNRLEIVRNPQVVTPKDPKVKAQLDFSVHSEWALDSSSYDDPDEAPKIIDAFVEAATKIGFLEKSKGFCSPLAAVNEAMGGLLPWTQNFVPVLARAELKVVGSRQSGDREYMDYSLVPHKKSDYKDWSPCLLVVNNDRWIDQFFSRAEEFMEANGALNVWGRKNPPLMLFEKNDKGHYGCTFQTNKYGDIPIDLWKQIREDMPDMQSRMDKLKLTDEQIADAFSRSWWFSKILNKYPQLKEVFSVAEDTEWDDDEEEDSEAEEADEETETPEVPADEEEWEDE